MFECFVDEGRFLQVHPLLLPYMKGHAVSDEESEQRLATELVFGAMRGSR